MAGAGPGLGGGDAGRGPSGGRYCGALKPALPGSHQRLWPQKPREGMPTKPPAQGQTRPPQPLKYHDLCLRQNLLQLVPFLSLLAGEVVSRLTTLN
jgi:hypothetical protein